MLESNTMICLLKFTYMSSIYMYYKQIYWYHTCTILNICCGKNTSQSRLEIKKTNAIKNVVLMQWSLKVCGLNAGNTVIRFRSFSSMKYMYLLLG